MILERVANAAFRPHKRLLDHVACVIRQETAFAPLAKCTHLRARPVPAPV